MRSRTLPFLLAVAACVQAEPGPPDLRTAAGPVTFDVKDDLIDFHFAWSNEIEAIPELSQRLREKKDSVLAELVAGAEEERRLRNREKYGLTFNGFQSSTDYLTAGQSPRLLSVVVKISAYTGGAHGNHGSSALLWDRAAAAEIAFASLFERPADRDRLLREPWCDALDAARTEKRGEPVRGGGMFDQCPTLDEVSVVPADKDKNGRFDKIVLIADPYVAGSYAEGEYEIALPVTAAMIDAIKPEFRPSFEAQPQ